MSAVTIDLTDPQARLLVAEALRLGLRPEDLARAAVLDLIERRDDAFLDAAHRVLEKNAELYLRLR